MFKNHRFVKTLCFVYAFLIVTVTVQAQPKSIGVNQSFRGVWVSYEQFIDTDCFISVEAGVLLSELFTGTSKFPGYSAKVNWNFTFIQKQIDGAGELSLFAGPGLSIGYDSDFRRHPGILFGVSGRFGVECAFPRRLTLTACINPVIGSHILILEDSVNMNFYKKGFMYGLLPEIGIKYNF